MEIARFLGLMIFMGLTTLFDIKSRKIPLYFYVGAITYAVIITLLEIIFFEQINAVYCFNYLGGAALGMLFIVVSVISKEAIGLGDSLAIMVIGLFVGILTNIEIMLWSFFICALYGMVLWIIRKRKISIKSKRIAFMPFLMTGCILSLI